MKKLQKTIKIVLLFLVILVFSTCEKDLKMDDIAIDQERKAASSEIDQSTIDQINYLYSLIEKIEALVEEGQLNRGNANALIVKIENSIKSLENGNDNAAENQLSGFINQSEDYVENGVLSEEQGSELINDAETGIILTDGSFTDPRDGQEYKVVLIGDQVWMAENLRYLPEVSPPSEGSFIEPYYYVYDYEGTNVTEAKTVINYQTYGVLYNWSAAISSCPDGWHLPTDNEWKQLEMFLGMSQIQVDDTGLRGTDEGSKLKSTSGWYNNGNGTDEYGFSCIPGGCRLGDGYFYYIESYSNLWTSTESQYNNIAWNRYLFYNWSSIWRYIVNKDVGFSVRCIKD